MSDHTLNPGSSDFFSLATVEFTIPCDSEDCTTDEHPSEWTILLECSHFENWCGTRFRNYATGARRFGTPTQCSTCGELTTVVRWIVNHSGIEFND